MSLLSYDRLMDLVLSGVIDADPANVNGASIDITLGSDILLEMDLLNRPQLVDLAAKEHIQTYPKETFKTYTLDPGEFILASSVEVFNLPTYIAAEYKLKSSLARCGLQHMLAGWCDPGWTGSTLTLELKNVTRRHSLKLTAGMKIGQMVFWECPRVPGEQSYEVTGQYNNDKTVTGNKGVR